MSNAEAKAKVLWRDGAPVDYDVAAELRSIADQIDRGEINAKRCLVVWTNPRDRVYYSVCGEPGNASNAVAMLEWAKLDIYSGSTDPNV